MGIYTKVLRKYTNIFSQYRLPCIWAELCTRTPPNIKLKNCPLEHNVRVNGIWHKQFGERNAQKCVLPDLLDDIRPDYGYDATATRHKVFARAAYFLSFSFFLSLPWKSQGQAVSQLVESLRYSRKVAGSIPVCVIRIFHSHNPSGRTMTLGMTQPLTEMSTRNISWGVKATGA
jgi:hypothetical protein